MNKINVYVYVYEILCLKTILKIVLIFYISTPLRFLENVYEKKNDSFGKLEK